MKIFFYKLSLATFEYCSPFLLQFVFVATTSQRPTSVMAPVSYTEICKQLESCYKLESITPEKVVDPEDAATHVRYYIPLTSEEYTYMLEDTTKPKVATITATTRMPLYDRINGMILADQRLPLLAYLYTEGNIYTNHVDHFYILQVYIGHQSLHDRVECGDLCLFKRDHVSPTLGFDQSYKFDAKELELQQVLKASFCGDYNLLSPLHLYNFSTGHAWDFWIIMEIKDLLQELSKEEPAKWATRFVYNWSAYLGPLIFKTELTDTTKVQLLEHMFELQCLPSIEDGNTRTMDHVRGSTSAMEAYKNMPALELQQMVEDWRKTATENEKANTALDEGTPDLPPTKKRAT